MNNEYILKPEFAQYAEAVRMIALNNGYGGKYTIQTYGTKYIFSPDSLGNLKMAGVLDLWFEQSNEEKSFNEKQINLLLKIEYNEDKISSQLAREILDMETLYKPTAEFVKKFRENGWLTNAMCEMSDALDLIEAQNIQAAKEKITNAMKLLAHE